VLSASGFFDGPRRISDIIAPEGVALLIPHKLMPICLVAIAFFAISSAGQSSDQNFPSPVTESQIASTIRARDMGDARLTTHYWVFDGAQGDLFINVVTQNFSGEINVYQASDLKPLTQMVMYADTGVSETGRVIYMRRPGRLMLRVQGRTPNDDPATYSIKFAGSFVALASQKQEGPPTVGSTEETGIKVNSVGTIIAAPPKTLPVATPSPERQSEVNTAVTMPPTPREDEATTEPKSGQTPAKENDANVHTVFGNKSAKVTVTNAPPSAPARPPATRTTPGRPSGRAVTTTDPMAGYRLVIVFKDGSRAERDMSAVVRFAYDRGFLSIVGKDGSVDKYPATVVASVTVQQP
jgi:hypothetical protein